MGLTNWQLFFQGLDSATKESPELNSEILGYLKQVSDHYDFVEVTDSLYATTILSMGADAYWKLAAGALDSYLPSPHNGTNNGYGVRFGWPMAAFVDGSKSAFFDGGSYLTTTKNNATNFTINAWVYPISYGGDLCIIGTSTLRPIELSIKSNGNLEVYLTFTTSSPGFADTGAKLPLNTWSFISITWDGSIITVYVNASQVYITGAYIGLTIKQDAFVMGRNILSTTAYLRGYLAHVSHHTSVLTAGNLATLYSLRNTVLTQYSVVSPPFVVGSALVGFSEVG